MLIAALTLTLALAPQNWSNLGGNAARNGATAVEGPLSAELLWSNTDDFSLIAWQPVVDRQRVFTVRESGFPQNGGAANDALVAYDLHSGGELWRRTLDFGGDTALEWIAWIAGAQDGRVYASRASHMQPAPLQAFDGTSGAPLWTSALSVQTFAYDGIAFAADGDLLVGDWVSVSRIDAGDGSTVWTHSRSCPVSGNCGPAATQDGVFIDQPGPGGNVVTKLDIVTGVELYSSPVMPGFTDQNAPFVSPDGGTVYFSRTQNNQSVDFLYAFEDTGAALLQRWMRPVRWTTSHEHGIAADGSLYVFLMDGEFVRLDPATGNVTASAGILDPLGNASPKTAVGANGTVYVSNGWASTPAGNGRVWAFPADLSAQLFVLPLDRQNQGGPALAQSGTLIVCDRLGVHAYREDFSHFCSASPNSSGAPGRLDVSGSSQSGAGNSLVLSASSVPNTPGLFFRGTTQISAPFGDGLRCAGGTIVRLNPVLVASGGTAQRVVDNAPFAPGELANFQFWFRDGAAGGAGFNTTDAVSVRFR